MIEQDSVRLLRECDAGVQMGIASITQVLDRVEKPAMETKLEECRRKHEALQEEIRSLLKRYRDEGKEPQPMARSMSWMKTEMKLAVHGNDSAIAELMIDGCNMGVKSLSKYLNQYAAADEASKDIAKRLIRLEEALSVALRDDL